MLLLIGELILPIYFWIYAENFNPDYLEKKSESTLLLTKSLVIIWLAFMFIIQLNIYQKEFDYTNLLYLLGLVFIFLAIFIFPNIDNKKN